ncbi:MAG: hypothetical protein QOD99_1470, partial [Chthoniobacter sp.]|nr:hypothetical protein [Chthoniobacter sp.]
MKTLSLFFLCVLPCLAIADVEEAWQQILALDAGPKMEWKTREEARTATVAHLGRQEKALRDFIGDYTADSRRVDAELRLAHLLATRADLQDSPRERTAASQMLDHLAKDAPPERRADVEFAKLSLVMQRVQPGRENERGGLLNKVKAFEKSFPGDRRIGPLLAEMATLYDDRPQEKKELIETALANTSDEGLKQRLNDDLKRIALLGQPVPLRFGDGHGQEIDVAKLHGRVVLVYFFASWSPPSIAALDVVRDIAAKFPTAKVQPVGVSLDETRTALDATLA